MKEVKAPPKRKYYNLPLALVTPRKKSRIEALAGGKVAISPLDKKTDRLKDELKELLR